MSSERTLSSRRFRAAGFRIAIYIVILLGVVAYKYVPRPWKPTITIETSHYVIASAATREQTEEVARVVEILYAAYSNRFCNLPTFKREHPRLQLRLYKDREQFRRVNPGFGWAEAYYRHPCCHAYYSSGENNPYHWMLHEAVHQLNREVAQLSLAKWIEEGLAEYFSTSRILDGRLVPGRIDPDTYPVWWAGEIAMGPELEANLANRSVIPLRAIISNHGGPSLDKEFNLYYLHWWTLTHFIFESENYGFVTQPLLLEGGGVDAFERNIGPVEAVEKEWHRHVRRIKAALDGNDVTFLRTGELPAESSGTQFSLPVK